MAHTEERSPEGPSQTRHRSSRGPIDASIPRVDVLGVPVAGSNIAQVVACLGEWIETDRRAYVTIRDAHGIVRSLDDPELLRIHQDADLNTTDGMPVVWCARRAGVKDAERVYGPDLMLATLEAGADRGWTHFFYGGAEGTPEALAAQLTDRIPGLKVVGTLSPPFRDLSPEEDDGIVAIINDADPDIVWVGLSTPKQERWMAAHRDRLHARVLLGVGAAFDFHSGNVRQAPRWVQRSGFEWLFRLAMEPRRLWRRYAMVVPRFAWNVARHRPHLLPAETCEPDHSEEP